MKGSEIVSATQSRGARKNRFGLVKSVAVVVSKNSVEFSPTIALPIRNHKILNFIALSLSFKI